MQKAAKYLVKSFNPPQLPEGPITPSPGPILPNDDADIATDETKSNPFIEMINEHNANISI